MGKIDLPLRPWAPQWIGVLTVLLIIIPIGMINGANIGSMLEVSDSLGVLSEDIAMGFYATSAGMTVAYPLVKTVVNAVTPKTLLLSDLIIQIFLCLFCTWTDNIDLIIVASFFIGFVRAFIIYWFFISFMPILAPNNTRSELYAWFFPFLFGVGQISIALTAQLAYHYDWTYIYRFLAVNLLLAVIFVLVFFRYAKRPIHFPWCKLHYRSMFLVGSGLLMTMYVFIYGKQQDWFESRKIVAYSIAAPLLLVCFFWQQTASKRPYLSLYPLLRKKNVIGYIYMFITLFFSTSTILVTNYLNNILRTDSVYSNGIVMWLLPGFIIGGIIGYWWYRYNQWSFRFLIIGGILCSAAFFASMYLGMTPDSTYEMLYLPMLVQGIGMMILVIGTAVYVFEGLEAPYWLSNIFFMLFFRTTLAAVIGMSVYNNTLYYLQQKYMVRLSNTITLADSVASARYSDTLQGALINGHGMSEARQIATNTLYSVLQEQSTLMALKSIFGWLLIAALIIATVTYYIPFYKTDKGIL